MKKVLQVFCTLCIFFSLSACRKTREAGMTITVFDSGKADAILIQMEDGDVLIDTGLEKNGEELIDNLKDAGVTKLEALIITHFDKDHIGGAAAVLKNITVENVYTTYQTEESDEIKQFYKQLNRNNQEAVVVQDKLTFSIGEAAFTIYGASGNYEDNEDNNASLITQVVYGEENALFMGDAEDERIAEFLAEYDGKCDFLKVPYHGHYQDSLAKLLETLKPSVSVITNSEEEPDEDEVEQTVRLLEAAGSAVYLTSEGTITVSCTKTGLTVAQS